jgi:hypothetical protein
LKVIFGRVSEASEPVAQDSPVINIEPVVLLLMQI